MEERYRFGLSWIFVGSEAWRVAGAVVRCGDPQISGHIAYIQTARYIKCKPQKWFMIISSQINAPVAESQQNTSS